MSSPQLSVVVAFRDRAVSRVDSLFTSLTKHTSTPVEMIVSDYGSREPCREELVELSQQRGFRVVRSEAEGLPWNKARALNVAVRAAAGAWILIVDVDMVFHDAVVDHLFSQIRDDQIWLLESIWPQTKRQKPLKGKRLRSPGVFQMMNRVWFDRVHGYCEDYEFWGLEDSDWVQRVEAAGAEVNWLSSQHFHLTHSWHPRENNPATRPFTAVSEALQIEVRNGWVPYSNPDWGRPLTLAERPVLAAIHSREPHIVDLGGGALQPCIGTVKKLLEAGELVCLNLGKRIPDRLLTRFAGLFFYFHELLRPFSLRVEYNVQGNLETLLALRKVLGKERVDLFLTPGYEKGFLILK